MRPRQQAIAIDAQPPIVIGLEIEARIIVARGTGPFELRAHQPPVAEIQKQAVAGVGPDTRDRGDGHAILHRPRNEADGCAGLHCGGREALRRRSARRNPHDHAPLYPDLIGGRCAEIGGEAYPPGRRTGRRLALPPRRLFRQTGDTILLLMGRTLDRHAVRYGPVRSGGCEKKQGGQDDGKAGHGQKLKFPSERRLDAILRGGLVARRPAPECLNARLIARLRPMAVAPER